MKNVLIFFILIILFQVSILSAGKAMNFLDEIDGKIEKIKTSQNSSQKLLSYEEFRHIKKIHSEKQKVKFLKGGDIVRFHKSRETQNENGTIYKLPKGEGQVDLESLSPTLKFETNENEGMSYANNTKILEIEKSSINPDLVYFSIYKKLGERDYYLDKKTRQLIIKDRHPSTKTEEVKKEDNPDLLALKVFLLLHDDENLYIGLFNEKKGYLGLHNPHTNVFWSIVNDKRLKIKKPTYQANDIYYLCDEGSDGLRLWVANPLTQQKALVAAPSNEHVNSYSVSKDGSWFYIKVKDMDKGGYQIYEYAQNATGETKWAKRSKTLQQIIYNQQNPNLALVKESDSCQLPRYSLRYSKNGQLKTERILLYDTQLKDFRLERFSEAIFGKIPSKFENHMIPILFWPPHHIKEKTFPLYVDIHGGPDAESELEFNPNIQYWTSRGYGVLEINYRGSRGFGKKWEKALHGQVAKVDSEDCYSAISFCAEKVNSVNKKRIYLGGSSYGAYITAILISDPKKYPPCFAAAEMRCGIYDCANNGEFDEGSHRCLTAKKKWLKIYGGNPKEDYELNKRISPIEKINDIPTTLPLLISHGGKDEQTSPIQASKYAELLKQNGKNVTFIFYPESGHGYKEKDNKDWFEKAEKFFEQNGMQ